MSDSTWLYITPSPFWGGRLGTWCWGDLCRCDRKCWEDIWVIWLIVCLEMIPWTRLFLQPYITVFLPQHSSYRLHIRQPFQPRASRGRVLPLQRRLLSSSHVRARVVTPSLTISPWSLVSVLRSSSTVSWPPFPPSYCRRADDLLRPAAAATSAPPFFLRGSATRRQFDTDTFRATSCRIVIINLLPSVHTS